MEEKTRNDQIFEKEWQWRMARNRMMGYLDALGVPPVEALETSCEVFARIRSRGHIHDSMKLLQEAMQMLRLIMAEQNRIETDNLMDLADAELVRRPIPPMKQGRMQPDGPERDSVDGLFKWMLKKGRPVRRV